MERSRLTAVEMAPGLQVERDCLDFGSGRVKVSDSGFKTLASLAVCVEANASRGAPYREVLFVGGCGTGSAAIALNRAKPSARRCSGEPKRVARPPNPPVMV